ncbi:hypothetical protein [Corynebacterium macginleyi]|uniref:hypothetical protein n=1 Tax=Corynebacterium macginleyi TaxID=38290 RepID=UPI001F1683A9|nr:hypothetical protein [Corynebacterium macginleyi]
MVSKRGHFTGSGGACAPVRLGLELVGVLILVLLIRPDTNGWIIAAPPTLYGLGRGFASVQLIGTVL